MEVQVASQGDRLCAAFEHSITWEDDLWRADPVDVEAIHANARRRFSELLGAVSETSSAQARILLRHLPPPLRVTPDQITMLLAGTECDIAPMRGELGIDPASMAEAYTR